MSVVRRFAVGLALATAACGGQLEGASSSKSDAGTRSDAGPSTTTKDSFDISSLPGLVLWLDASKGITLDDTHQHAVLWADQSQAHNDLKLLQGNGASRDGAYLGKSPTLRFDGATAYQLAPSPELADWTGDFLVEIALHVDIANPHNQGFFSCFGEPPNVPGFTMVDTYITKGQTAACDILSDGYTDNASTHPVVNIGGYLVGFRRVGTTMESRRNGVVDASVTVKHLTTPTCTTAYFGALPSDGTTFLDGFASSAIAEVVIAHGTVSDDVVTKLETSLRTKYNLPNF